MLGIRVAVQRSAMVLLVLTAFVSVALTAERPASSWGGEGDEFVFLAQTENGEFYGVGWTTSYGTQTRNALMLKVNRTLDGVEWGRVWSWIDGTVDFEGPAIASNGDLVFGGCTNYNPTNESCNGDVFLLKYDGTGTFQWAKTWSSEDGTAVDDADAVAIDASGNIYVTGGTTVSGVTETLLLKWSPSGDLIWDRKWKRSEGFADSANAIGLDALGNVYLGGNTQNLSGRVEALVMKYDPDGNLLWAKSWSNLPIGTINNDAFAMLVSAAGDVLLAGVDDNSGVRRQFLTRVDSNGSVVGSIVWEHGGGLDSDGGVVSADAAGTAAYVGGVLSDPDNIEPTEGLILAYDSAGGLLASKRWTDPVGAQFATFLPIGSKRLLVSGYTVQTEGPLLNTGGSSSPGVPTQTDLSGSGGSAPGTVSTTSGVETVPVGCAQPPCGGADVMFHELTRVCLGLDPGLSVNPDLCSGGASAPATDVIRGDLESLRIDQGQVDLGDTRCVASGVPWDRVSDLSPVPVAGTGTFYLAKASTDPDFGNASTPRTRWNDVDPCP